MHLRENRLFTSSLFLIIVLIVLSWYLFIFKIGQPSLWETDEAIYGEVAKEILRYGDWWTLRFNYREWFDKPPLYMWLTASLYSFFGWNEFTTRIWSALFGIGVVIAVYFLGKTMFNKRVGFLSALILATSFQFIVQSRIALVDVPLTFFVSLSILFFYLGHLHPDKSWYYLLSSLCMALAALTKVPVVVLMPVSIIAIYLLFTKKAGRLRGMRLPWLLAVFLVVASPWYIIELLRHGRVFVDNFFLVRTISRFTTEFEGHTGPAYYYVPILFLGFFPWSSFLPYSFVRLFRKWKAMGSEERAKHILLVVWFIMIFLFFSLAKSKLPGYIFPLYPACALGTALLWEEFIVSKTITRKRGPLISFALYFILVAAFAVILIFVARSSFPLEYSLFRGAILLIVVGLFVGGALSVVFLFLKKNAVFSLIALLGTMCFLVWVLTTYVMPLTEVFKPTKFLAHQITSTYQSGERIGNYPASKENFMSFDCALIYYSDHPVVGIETPDDLKAFFASEKRVYCLMATKAYQEVEHHLKGTPLYVLDQRGGKILLSNRQNE